MQEIPRKVCVTAMLFLLTFTGLRAETCKGCVDLDEFSFQKLVPRFKYTLVKYDIAYPYGDKHDAFVQFAESIQGVTNIIAANIGVKDYGQKDNADFAQKQGVDTSKLPVVKLYKGLNEVFTYEDEEFTTEKLREFVVENSDVQITLAGCIEMFDLLALKFVQGGDDVKVKILQEMEDYAPENELEVKAKKTYLLFMKKILENEDFVGKEHQRLKKILTEGKLSEAKIQDIQNKRNILHAFTTKTKHSKTEL